MARLKFLCALSYLASGSYQRISGKNINCFVPQHSVSHSIHEVVEALSHPDILKKCIRFPRNARERLELKERFYKQYRIPGIIGCVDGTYIAMIRSKQNEECYYCCKGYHARNVMILDMHNIHT